MAKIFISYRRSDCQHQADRLHTVLGHYVNDPKTDIFIDIDNIPFGVDFVDYLEAKVSQCEVLFALIADRWLGQDSETGHRRIDDSNDFVRIEIASALRRDIPVVPIVLDDVTMPSEEVLPNELKPLARRNAALVRRLSFEDDVARLIKGLPIDLKAKSKRPSHSKETIISRGLENLFSEEFEGKQKNGVFTKLLNDMELSDWTQPEAYLAILLAAMRAGNEISWQKKEYIQALVRRSRTMREYINSPEALTAINLAVEERIKTRPNYLVEAVHAMPRDSHFAMLAHCVDIVLADGAMKNQEHDFLDGLIEEMSITKDQAKNIVEVVYEKSRY